MRIAESTLLIVVLVIVVVRAAEISRRSSATSASDFHNLSAQRYEIWAALALGYVRNVSCDRAFFAVPDQCRRMKQTAIDQMNLYSAEAGKHRKLIAITPDASMSRAGAHDGVIVIDPFPAASFGHFVIVFFIDHLDRASCELGGGIYIENHNDCIRLAQKDRCHDPFHMQQRFEANVKRHATQRLHRCEIDFLPFVYETGAGNSAAAPRRSSPVDEQRLQCREADGFARCPTVASTGTHGGHRGSLSSSSDEDAQSPPSIRCLLFEVCDHAVVIHGGWGRMSNRKNDFAVLRATRSALQANGFVDSNVKLFYKNGVIDEQQQPIENADHHRQHQRKSSSTIRREAGDRVTVSPAADKRAVRTYVQSACSKLHCVDTLAVFLKGPATYDGSLLLFDADGDGLASDDEKYTMQEIARDLANCSARRVFVVADFSYSGRLISALRASPRGSHQNVVAVSSGDHEQYSWDNQFTTLWTNHQHRSACFKSVFHANKDLIARSTPIIFGGSSSTDDEEEEDLGTSLSGAPCDLYPPLTELELRARYWGCNNVPSWFWFQSAVSNATVAPSPPPSISSRRRRK